MLHSTNIFLRFSIVVLYTTVAGTTCALCGIVKNADLGGYKVVVEGGGVEGRKEIQYDSEGKEIFNSEDSNLKMFGGSAGATALFGDETGGELKLDNLTPANISKAAGASSTTAPKKLPLPESSKKSVKAESQQSFSSNPWARRVTTTSKSPQKKEPEDKASGVGVMIDPRTAMLSQPKTEDGRTLPFYLGERKTTGGSGTSNIEEDTTLRNFSKLDERYSGNRNQPGAAEGFNTTDRYTDIITPETWHSKFSTLGGKRNTAYSKDSYFPEAKYPDANIIERNIIDNNLMWSRSRRSHIAVDDQLAQKIIYKYAASQKFAGGEIRLPSPQNSGLSMQDINRYHFRRNHSSDPGISTTAPGGDVKKK